jgi:hypothetical protein
MLLSLGIVSFGFDDDWHIRRYSNIAIKNIAAIDF